jgi:membrane protein required for colicin V production
MTLDLIALTLTLLLFVRGYKKGVIVALFSVFAILLGITCALTFSAKLSNFLLEKGYASSALAPLISYAILFISMVWLVRLLAKFIEKLTSTILLGWINKSIGGLLYVAVSLVIYSSVLWLCNQAHLLSPETLVGSLSYKYIEPIAPWVFDHIGEVIPFAKNTFADMRHFFEGINQQLPEHVGSPR